MHMSCSVFLWFQAEDGIRDAQESRGLKQKTAYEMLRSLVGSEMCIRDSVMANRTLAALYVVAGRMAEAEGPLKIIADANAKAVAPRLAVSYTHLTLPT